MANQNHGQERTIQSVIYSVLGGIFSKNLCSRYCQNNAHPDCYFHRRHSMAEKCHCPLCCCNFGDIYPLYVGGIRGVALVSPRAAKKMIYPCRNAFHSSKHNKNLQGREIRVPVPGPPENRMILVNFPGNHGARGRTFGKNALQPVPVRRFNFHGTLPKCFAKTF